MNLTHATMEMYESRSNLSYSFSCALPNLAQTTLEPLSVTSHLLYAIPLILVIRPLVSPEYVKLLHTLALLVTVSTTDVVD